MGMTSPGRGAVRVVRATVLTGLVILLTAAAHRLGGGEAPGLLSLAVLALGAWPVALLSTGRRLRPTALLAGLGAGQVLGHGLLAWLGGAAVSGPASIECLTHAAHERFGRGCLDTSLTPAVSAHAHQPSPGGWMLGAHVLATVIAALLVARGEQVLWRVLDLVLRTVPVLVRPVALRPVRAVAVQLVPARPRLDVRASRGPPAYAA